MWFARMMELKLQANDHKGGWQDMSVPEAASRILDEVEELYAALREDSDNIDSIVSEAIDVANFAMMTAQIATLKEQRNIPTRKKKRSSPR